MTSISQRDTAMQVEERTWQALVSHKHRVLSKELGQQNRYAEKAEELLVR